MPVPNLIIILLYPFITFNNGGIIINRREMEQQKISSQVISGLNFEKKRGVPNCFINPET